MKNSPRKRAKLLARGLPILLIDVLLSGCGSSGTVSGKVLYNGKPVTGGHLTFQSEKGIFRTIIGEDGTYRIGKVPIGPVKIAVENEALKIQEGQGEMISKAVPKDKQGKDMNVAEMMKGMQQQMQKGAIPGKYVRIPAKAKDPEKSGLTYTVTSGSQVHDIELKD
jgi:hypothetical protein